jgi:hypothetical protein
MTTWLLAGSRSSPDTVVMSAENFGKCDAVNRDWRLIGTYDAETWTEAMQLYHNYMGFEPYKPME